MDKEEKIDLKAAFEVHICKNCTNMNCTKKLLIQILDSKVVKPVYSIKCSNYIKANTNNEEL